MRRKHGWVERKEKGRRKEEIKFCLARNNSVQLQAVFLEYGYAKLSQYFWSYQVTFHYCGQSNGGAIQGWMMTKWRIS